MNSRLSETMDGAAVVGHDMSPGAKWMNRNTQQLLEEMLGTDASLRMAAEAFGASFWMLDCESGAMTVLAAGGDATPRTLNGFLAGIVPQDRAATARAIQEVTNQGTESRAEYRVLAGNEPPRWISSQWRCIDEPATGRRSVFCVSLDISRQKQAEEALRATRERADRLALQANRSWHRREVAMPPGMPAIVGNSNALLQSLRQAEQVANTDSTVLILGETGTGKELLAQYIHGLSGRANKPFITMNIAAIPATLLEAELFGREKGAFTGALSRQAGRFELADGGTLLIDEIGEMPIETQVKLLRVLQSGEFERLGSSMAQRANVRVLAATNRDLPEMIKAGTFRQDLFYRLNVFPITLPPLRQRVEDIPLLVWAFVKEFSERMGKKIDRIRKKDLETLQSAQWHGNIRELRNVVERSMILAQGGELCLSLPDAPGAPQCHSRRLDDVERAHILDVLQTSRGRIYGANGAAEILGLKPTTLYSLMKRLQIPRTRR